MYKVAIIMGSKSDFDAVKPARDTLIKFGIETECRIMSAHRTPDIAHDFAKNAIKNGFGVIIAAAGKAAHLAGVLASNTILPVIGIPVKSSTMDGLDSLLSTVQMPTGIPVATVAINGGGNAAAAVEMDRRAGGLRGRLLRSGPEMGVSPGGEQRDGGAAGGHGRGGVRRLWSAAAGLGAAAALRPENQSAGRAGKMRKEKIRKKASFWGELICDNEKILKK